MFFFQITFKPKWDDISMIRKMIIAMFSEKVTDSDSAYRIALIVSELMENVCKYSNKGTAVSIRIKYSVKTSNVSICIKNITNPENLNTFKHIYDMVYEEKPMESYKKMMLRSTDGRSLTRQLGLARVRYEGKAKIKYIIIHDIHELMDGNKNSETEQLITLKIQINTRVTPLSVRRH